MSAAIYRQYLDDYANKAKQFNRQSYVYNNSIEYQGGPRKAQSQDGQTLGLWDAVPEQAQIVNRGKATDFEAAFANQTDRPEFVQPRDENGNATSETGTWLTTRTVGDGAYRGEDGQWYTNVGGGVAARRTGGKPTGETVTQRMSVDPETGVAVDKTYEVMKFAKSPGEFMAKKPSLSLQQLREAENPTPTAADLERAGDSEMGLIQRTRANQMKQREPSITDGLIYGAKGA